MCDVPPPTPPSGELPPDAGDAAQLPVGNAPAVPHRSPLDVPGIDLGLTADEIVAYVREGRERG